MKKISLIALPFILSSITAGANPHNGLQNVTVSVFTSLYYPIQHAQLADKIYALDRVEQIEEAFQPNIPIEPQQAEQYVKQVMNTPVWQQFEQELKTAYNGVTSGWKLGVMKIPAIVFERVHPTDTAVIYGETDVAKAIEYYRSTQLHGGK